MSLAIGGSLTSTRPAHGELWVDVRDYGAKADDGVTDNSAPIQAAIDDLAAKLNDRPDGPKGIVYIPSALGTYVVSKTIWVDCPNIEIRGDGWGSQVQMSPFAKHSVFLFGIRRVESAVVNGTAISRQIDETNRPDLFGKLDATTVSSSGQMWGLRTNADSFVQVQASPLSAGIQSVAGAYCSDYWTETTELTVEFCIEPPDGQQFPTNHPLIALGSTYYQPSPLVISMWDDPNKVWVTFKTSEFGPDYNAGCRSFAFSVAGATPPYRVAFQIDLINAACSAFVNGAQVGFVYTNNLSSTSSYPFTPGGGLTFQQNDYFPLMIGTENAQGPLFGTTGLDLRLYGLRFSNTLRYQNNGAGQPQRRVDSPSSPITDAYAYFGNDAGTIGFLSLTDNPAGAGRTVSVQHGNILANGGVGSGLFLHTDNSGGIIGNAVRDLAVMANYGHGQAIGIGGVLEMAIENVKAVNGFHGIGSVNFYKNSNIYITNCRLGGFDAAYYGAFQSLFANDIFCEGSGRAMIRLYGCDACWNDSFVASSGPNTECLFKAHSHDIGGHFSVSNLFVDFQGQTLCLAAFYCEAHALSPATSLNLKNISLGTICSKAALVMVKDTGPRSTSLHRCWLSVDNLQASTCDYPAAVDVDGPLWHGEVKGVALDGPQFHHRGRWGTDTNIVIRDTKYAAPPRAFLWYAGAHVLEVRSPSDGQFAEWRCIATGAYGTPDPPRWLGINSLAMSPNGLAAYVCSHCYATATMN